MLIQLLQQILELPDPREEAKRKLTTTYMKVNGECMYVNSFNFEKETIWGLVLREGRIQEIITQVHSLEIWLPSSGIYRTSSGKIHRLTKIPKRQWLKSFSFSFYEISNFDDEKEIYELMDATRSEIHLNNGGTIDILGRAIGKIEKGKLYCTDSLFKQELIEWKINHEYDIQRYMVLSNP